MKIYTKTGDRGETSLFDGSRVVKCDTRVSAYGDVDECNAAIGAAAALLGTSFAELKTELAHIQRKLFNVGALLADPLRKSPKQEKESVRVADIEVMEHAIDARDKVLPPLRAFILPGGSPAGAAFHLARTVCRRAERNVMALHQKMPVPLEVIQYLNRLSDYLFVAARFVNYRDGIPEEKW